MTPRLGDFGCPKSCARLRSWQVPAVLAVLCVLAAGAVTATETTAADTVQTIFRVSQDGPVAIRWKAVLHVRGGVFTLYRSSSAGAMIRIAEVAAETGEHSYQLVVRHGASGLYQLRYSNDGYQIVLRTARYREIREGHPTLVSPLPGDSGVALNQARVDSQPPCTSHDAPKVPIRELPWVLLVQVPPPEGRPLV